jgi:hypothetical protein
MGLDMNTTADSLAFVGTSPCLDISLVQKLVEAGGAHHRQGESFREVPRHITRRVLTRLQKLAYLKLVKE